MNISKKIKLLDFKLKKRLGGGLFGFYKSKFLGQGIDFAEHKEYSFGDPIKNIDWKASSRSDQTYLKKYDEERDLNVLFLLNSGETMDFGSEKISKKEILEEIFYTLSFSANQNSDSIGGYVYNTSNEKGYDFVKFAKGKGNIFKILEFLNQDNENLEYNSKCNSKKINKNLSDILKILEKQNLKNTLIFILTDEVDDNGGKNLKILKKISKNNEIIYINIFDYFENNLIDSEKFFSKNKNFSENKIFLNFFKKYFSGIFSFGENFLDLNFLDSEKIKKFQILRKEKIKKFENDLRKNFTEYLFIDSKMDFYKEILKFFKKVSLRK